jgi:5-methylcytosine-specific restriction protein A
MNTVSAEQVSQLILRKLGLRTDAGVTEGAMVITPRGYHSGESFSIEFNPSWRSADALLAPGAYAGSTVRSMGEAPPEAKQLFVGYVDGLRRQGVQIAMKINGAVVDAGNVTAWPSEWTSFEISVRKTALVFDLNLDAELLPVADLLVTPLVGMAMALVGTENIESSEGEFEGAALRYLATKLERKKLNRDACIRIHGTRCHGCGFDFGEFYGELAHGYIEIHHIESLAASGEVRVNPATDLVPLCSNCHSVVHRVSPPLPLDELRRLVAERRVE